MRSIPYANAVGCLIHLMVCTRPDLAYAVSIVSRYLANPGKEHWQAAKWIFRYLNGSIQVGFVFGKNKHAQDRALVYVYSDFTKDLDSGRSMTRYVFTLMDGVVSWKANLLSTVALSTTEAEFVAMTDVTTRKI